MAKKNWGKAGVDAIKRYYDGIGKGDRAFFLRSDVPLYTMAIGDHVLRVMPPYKGGDFFGLEIFVHSGIGINKDSFLCTEKTKLFAEEKLSCPICAKAAKLAARGAADEEVWPLKPRKKVLFNIVDLDKPRDGVKVWVCPITAADDIVRLCYDKRTKELKDITDPEEGYDIYVTREGEGLQTRYKGIQTDKTTSAIDAVYLDGIHDLAEILILPDEKTIKRALAEDDEVFDDETAKEDEPSQHWEDERRKPIVEETEEHPPQKSVRERVKDAARERYGRE